MTVEVDRPVNPRQLAHELADRQSRDDPVPVRGRIDRDTDEIVVVAADVDEDELRAAVDEHQADFPPPTPHPVDVMVEAVRDERPDAVSQISTLLDHLAPILRDLERRR